MAKENKTNAMRILDKEKIRYKVNLYECDEFIDGKSIADKLEQSYEISYKTLVTVGKSKNYFVFCIPVDKELNLKKAAKAVLEKNLELIHVKDINSITGYIRGGCTPIGMKKKYTTVIDESVILYDEVIISGGKIGAQIFIKPQDLIKITEAKIKDICE